MATRRELIAAIRERYHSASRAEKEKILDEFTEATGFHRKHAIRALRRAGKENGAERDRARIYDAAVIQALTILWKAADRICGKRLKQAIPTLLEAMERHGHLDLDADVRQRVLKASAATIDRLLAFTRAAGRQSRRRSSINTPLRKSIAVRTFSDWNDPLPGSEMKCIALEEPGIAGIWIKVLRFDERSGRAPTFLLKFDPGATYPAHNHPGGEETFVLEGDTHFGPDHLHEGDYLYTVPNNKHAVWSDGGCVVMFNVPQEVERLKP